MAHTFNTGEATTAVSNALVFIANVVHVVMFCLFDALFLFIVEVLFSLNQPSTSSKDNNVSRLVTIFTVIICVVLFISRLRQKVTIISTDASI